MKDKTSTLKLISRVIFGLLFTLAGINHFLNSAFYESIMPPYLPFPHLLVIVSGVFEIVLGLAVIIPKYSRFAAWGLILLLIAVFPANIHMAMHPEKFPDMSTATLIVRLPLQLVLILWAYWYTRGQA